MAQENEFANVIKAIETQNFAKLSEKEKNALEHLSLQDGILCWSDGHQSDQLLIVLPYNLREKVIKQFHENKMIGGHLGFEKTSEKLMNRFYWPKMSKDIEQIVKSCAACQLAKTVTRPIIQPLCPIAKVPRPFFHIHIDIAGPLLITQSLNHYILVIIDGFSKYVIATPLRNQKARTISQKLIDEVFCKFGCPSVITTDQGGQFMGEVFDDLSELMGFDHFPTTAYHQSANGQVERFNQTVKKMFACYATRHDWDKSLQQLIFAYNNSWHSSIQETPFFIVHGWDPKLPTDVALKIDTDTVDPDLSLYKQSLARTIRHAWEVADKNIKSAQTQQKGQYDKRHAAKGKNVIKVGDLVLKKVENYVPYHSNSWEGPFRVLEIEWQNATIEHYNKLLTVHMDKIKVFKTPQVLPLRPLHSFDVKIDGSKRKIYQDAHLEQSDSE